MTRDEIIEMARQAGVANTWDLNWYDPAIERFAWLVQEHEREACAKDLDEVSEAAKDVDSQGFVWRAVKECADAIRARGQA
jgi:hypothetical protein